MHNFRRLEVWRDSVELACKIYALTRLFPPEERFGLAAQMRSAVVLVSSNIAEGAGRGGTKEMARSLRIAMGSISELDSQLEVAARLRFVETQPEIADDLRALRARILRLHDRVSGARP
jgi:four helix bundle protein